MCYSKTSKTILFVFSMKMKVILNEQKSLKIVFKNNTKQWENDILRIQNRLIGLMSLRFSSVSYKTSFSIVNLVTKHFIVDNYVGK